MGGIDVLPGFLINQAENYLFDLGRLKGGLRIRGADLLKLLYKSYDHRRNKVMLNMTTIDR